MGRRVQGTGMHTGVALPSGGRSLGTHPSSRGAGLRYAPLPQMPRLLPHTCSLEALWPDWVRGGGGGGGMHKCRRAACWPCWPWKTIFLKGVGETPAWPPRFV